MKVVLNNSPMGFDVSNEVYEYLIKSCGWKCVEIPENDEDFEEVEADIFKLGDEYDFISPDLYDVGFRAHPDLVEAIEACGEKAKTESGAMPVVVEIPGLEYCSDLVIVFVPYEREFVAQCKDLRG